MHSIYESSAPTLLPSVVCVADILGYKEMSRRAAEAGTSNELLRALKHVLDKAFGALRDEGGLFGELRAFETRTFTDNVVVGCPIRHGPDAEIETATVFAAFAEYQGSTCHSRFLRTGGISFGGLYIDENMVFGPALIDAHDLDIGGKPPRLCLTRSHIERVVEQMSFYSGPDWTPHTRALLEDGGDGAIFLDYLAVAFEDFPDVSVNRWLLAAHRDQVTQRLFGDVLDVEVRAKYEWAARYHNFVLRRFIDAYGGFIFRRVCGRRVAGCCGGGTKL